MNKLTDFRIKIDSIDTSIVNLLAERMSVVSKIGEYKKDLHLSPLDENRWQQVLAANLQQAKQTGLDKTLVKKIYNLIHEHALKIQE